MWSRSKRQGRRSRLPSAEAIRRVCGLFSLTLKHTHWQLAPKHFSPTTTGATFPRSRCHPTRPRSACFPSNAIRLSCGPINETYRKNGLLEFTTADPTAEKPQMVTRPEKQFAVHLRYNEANPAPVTIRQQVARTMTSRSDMDYLLEVTFSGPDLSTATSCFRRVTNIQGKFSYEEVFGTRMVHSTYSTIEVPRPKRFEEKFKLYIVNSSKDLPNQDQGLMRGS